MINSPTRGYNICKYAPNVRAPKHIKHILTDLKGEIDSSSTIGGDFNTSLKTRARPSRQKINKGTLALNYILDQMDITDICRTFHSTAAENTFFSSTHGTFFRVDHMLGHKTNFSKFKKTEIISCILFSHNCMKLEITRSGKFTNT